MSGRVEQQQQQLTLAEVLETELLRCPQCRQHFTRPVLLPCLHAFCTPCLAALPTSDVTNGNDVKMVRLTCPLCQAAVTTPKDATPTSFLQSLCRLRAFKHGSESRTCSYCGFDGKMESAEWLCLDCGDDMCQACATSHRKTRVTRDHVTAPYHQIQQGLYDHDIRASQRALCPRHALELTHFCSDCATLACQHCQSLSHRGHQLLTTQDALQQLMPEAQSLMQGLRKRVPALTEYQAFLQTQLIKLAQRKAQVTESVNQQAAAIHQLVDQYKDSLLRELEEVVSQEAADVERRSKAMGVAKTSLESNAQFLSQLLALGSGSEVLELHTAVMARLKQLIHMQPDVMTRRLVPTYHQGPANLHNVRILLGRLETSAVPMEEADVEPQARLTVSMLLPPPLNPPHLLCTLPLKMAGDSKDVWPSGLHVRGRQLAVVDRDNKKVKIFDCSATTPTLAFQWGGKAEHQLQNPFDAALLETGVVVVTDTGAEKVKVFDVTGRWIADLSGDVRHPRGIAVTGNGEVVVVDGLLLRLTVHDPNTGQLINTLGDSGVLVDPFYLAVTESQHLVVTDHAAPNVKVLDMSGHLLASYGTYGTSITHVLKPYGVCVDRYGHVLVADSDNHRVHLLLPDGTFSCFLLTHQHKVSHPVTLAIDHQGHLVVGEAFGQLKVFKYL